MADPVIKYTGDGSEYHSGIPARDLSAAEYDALDKEQRATVRSSPIYNYSDYRDAAAKAKDAADAKTAKSDSAPAKDATK